MALFNYFNHIAKAPSTEKRKLKSRNMAYHSFIMAIVKPEGVVNIGPFFATLKYFQLQPPSSLCRCGTL